MFSLAVKIDNSLEHDLSHEERLTEGGINPETGAETEREIRRKRKRKQKTERGRKRVRKEFWLSQMACHGLW